MKPIAHIEKRFPHQVRYPPPEWTGQQSACPHCHGAGIPESRCVSGAGGLLPHLADLGILAGGAAEVVALPFARPVWAAMSAWGVFATRSPFRPNPLGLSVVQLEEIVLHGANAPYLTVSGADLMHGTPIYDIKPYLPHIDSHPEARGGFALPAAAHRLEVRFPGSLAGESAGIPAGRTDEVLAQDPRPSYQHDADRVYGFPFAGLEVRFTVDGEVLTVCEILKATV